MLVPIAIDLQHTYYAFLWSSVQTGSHCRNVISCVPQARPSFEEVLDALNAESECVADECVHVLVNT